MAEKSEKELALEQRIKDLEAAQDKTAKDHQAEIERSQKESDKLIADLQSKLEDAEASKGSKRAVITHKKEKYQVALPRFILGGNEYTEKDLQENRKIEVAYRDENGKRQTKEVKIVDHLIESGSGVLSALKGSK